VAFLIVEVSERDTSKTVAYAGKRTIVSVLSVVCMWRLRWCV